MASAGCRGDVVDVPRGEWEIIADVPGLTYLVPAGSGLDSRELDGAVERLLAFQAVLEEVWPGLEGRSIRYYRFGSREELAARTGRDVMGRAIPDEWIVHSVHAADAHEVAHLFTTPAGRPLRAGNFWLEGAAMYYTWPSIYYDPDSADLPFRSLVGAWRGRSVHENARLALIEGELPSLDRLVQGNREFDRLPDGTSYPAAGSFVTFLLSPAQSDLDAIARFRRLLDRANVARSTAEVMAAFADEFGRSLEEAESEWQRFLLDWIEADLD